MPNNDFPNGGDFAQRPETIPGALVTWLGEPDPILGSLTLYIYKDVLEEVVKLSRTEEQFIGLLMGRTAKDSDGEFIEIDGFDSVIKLDDQANNQRHALAQSLDNGPRGSVGWFLCTWISSPILSSAAQDCHDAYFKHRGVLLRISAEGDHFALYTPDDLGILRPTRFGLMSCELPCQSGEDPSGVEEQEQ